MPTAVSALAAAAAAQPLPLLAALHIISTGARTF